MAVVTGDEQVLAVLARHLVDAAHEFGKELAVKIRQHDADSIGALAAEAARRGVRRVAQVVGSLQHGRAHGFGHVVVAVERARHRGDRYLGHAGDILDGYVHAVLPPSGGVPNPNVTVFSETCKDGVTDRAGTASDQPVSRWNGCARSIPRGLRPS